METGGVSAQIVRLKNLEEARANEEIARKIHELKETQLARLIRTTPSVICCLEDPITKATPWQCCAGSRAR